jgi:hypothetical protein
VLSLIVLKFVRERGANSGLHLDNLLPIEALVVKNLPLLRGTLKHVEFLVLDSVVANYVFYYILELHYDFSENSVIFAAKGSSLAELELSRGVILI